LEIIFANYISDKELISRICKEQNSIAINQIIKFLKCAKILNRYFSKEDIQMVNRFLIKQSISLNHQKMGIRLPYQLIPVTMAINNKEKIISASEDA
jgi:hypothetical protein